MQLTFSSVEDIVTRPRFASKIDKPEYLQLRHSRLSLNANLMAEFEYEREREFDDSVLSIGQGKRQFEG